MSLKIDDERTMINMYRGQIIGHAKMIGDGWKVVADHVPNVNGYWWLDRNGAITALTLNEYLAIGGDTDDLPARAWRAEIEEAQQRTLYPTRTDAL